MGNPDTPIFPDINPASVRRSAFHVIENQDIATEEDCNQLLWFMYQFEDREFYFFHKKGEPLNALILGAERAGIVRIIESEYDFYPHPNFSRDFVRLRAGSANFDWEKDLLANGRMYIRTRIALTDRAKREMTILAVRDTHDPSSRSRLTKDEPASNMVKIAELIGAAQVIAAFDPYLDNRGLMTLRDILSLGTGGISPDARLLASETLVPHRLTKTFLEAWSVELRISAQMRLLADREHRRFLLLADGRALILGPSLNDVSKNEAAHIETNGQEDRAFFEEQWMKATPLA